MDSDAKLHIVWCDSLGAKSFSFAIEYMERYVLIDPGAAALQPSYPLDPQIKKELRRKAIKTIEKYARASDIIIITHYHYDHHVLPSDRDLEYNIYRGKKLFVKNPNYYINMSQWRRARLFLSELLSSINMSLEDYISSPIAMEFPDPTEKLVYAMSKNYGDYESRRRELLLKGKKWFEKLRQYWASHDWIGEIESQDIIVRWAENRSIEYGGVKINLLEPWYHGIEYDRTGWVVPLIIRVGEKKIFYTSDVMGPIIEDYAYYIADLKPDIILLDGPPTYLFPYMFNRINLNRAIDNAKYVIDQEPELIIYDHHLLRDPKWKKYAEGVLEHARKKNVEIKTCRDIIEEKRSNVVVLQ